MNVASRIGLAAAAPASAQGEDTTAEGVTPLAVVAWLVVGIPLVYGVYETVVKASALF